MAGEGGDGACVMVEAVRVEVLRMVVKLCVLVTRALMVLTQPQFRKVGM